MAMEATNNIARRLNKIEKNIEVAMQLFLISEEAVKTPEKEKVKQPEQKRKRKASSKR